MFINGMGFLVSILYTHSVVGGVVNCTGVIYGVRTSLFHTLQRMPSRYGCDYKAIQLLTLSAQKISIGDIFVSILYRCSVVGNNTYFIYTKKGGAM